jgi:transcriptional regulator of nitric oxide reductase
MTNVLIFTGPVTVSFEPGFPLPLTLSGQQRDAAGAGAIVSFDTATDPGLPAGLRDAEIELPAEPASQPCRLRAGGQEYSIAARRVFVHHDLRVPIRAVVPPQPVRAGYRWRWRLGIFLARVPLLRSWLS